MVQLTSLLVLLLLALSLPASAQSGGVNTAPTPQSGQPSQFNQPTTVKREVDELRQQLDIDAAALSKIPADPLIQPDPLAPIFRPVDRLTDRLPQSARLKFGATYKGTTSSADGSTLLAPGRLTIMEAVQDL